jgi:hypothetical protein
MTTKKVSLADALRKEQVQRPPQQPSAAPEAGGERRLVNFRLDPEVLHQLKLLALNEGSSLQALICEGINKVFRERNLPPIAK